MKLLRIGVGTLLCVIFFIATPANGKNVSSKEIGSIVRHNLLQPLSKINKKIKTSFALYDLGNEKSLYNHNSTHALIPASNLKLITALTALDILGNDFQFTSSLSLYRQPSNYSFIKQDLIFYSDGNPVFVSENLLNMAFMLKRMGVKQILGNIIIDASAFSPHLQAPSDYDKKGNAYNAYTAATAINFGSIEITVSPNSQIGKPCSISVSPTSPSVQIINQTKTLTKHSKLRIERSLIKGKDGFIFYGGLKANSKPRVVYRFAKYPLLYLGHSISSFLQRVGIKWKGQIKISRIKKKTEFKLAVVKSKPLGQIIRDMNKFSTNFIANQLVMSISAHQRLKLNKPGTLKHGVSLMGQHLKKLGIPKQEYRLMDGSGLSTANRLSARALVKTLVHGFQQFEYSFEHMASLPIWGVDGTLKNRSKQFPNIKYAIRAKTGSIRYPPNKKSNKNSISIAGYFLTPETHAFALIINNFPPSKYYKIVKLQEPLFNKIYDIIK